MKKLKPLLLIGFLVFLGLSPISEPHIFGKIKWISGGAQGMKTLDWLDIALHGGSLIISVVILIGWVIFLLKKK